MEDSYSKDSFTNLTDGLLLLVEQVHLPPFYFFWLICTIRAERYKPVFHTHVLIAKMLNESLYLLSCLPLLSYTDCPRYISKLDVVEHSFLVVF